MSAATIDLTFTSNYPLGVHTVCYRKNTDPLPGTCITVNCTPFTPPGSSTCIVSLPITVNNESCDPVTYVGTIQAACAVGDEGKIPFSITFTPNPTCKALDFICDNVDVQLIQLVAPNFGGAGYNPMTPPIVTFSGGGGTASATAVVGDTGVDGISIVNPGVVAYTDGPYFAVPTSNLSGIGVGLTVNITITGGVVTAVTPVVHGNGYVVTDLFEVPAGSIGGIGSGMQLQVLTVDTGKIIGFTAITTLTGYSGIPTISMTAPPLGGPVVASTNVVLQTCPEFNAGRNCDGSSKGLYHEQHAGEAFNICYTNGIFNGPSIPPSYTTGPSAACCYNCNTHTVTFPAPSFANPGGGVLTYTDCVTGHTTKITAIDATPIVICAVVGSLSTWTVNPTATVTVVVGADC